ncbi:plasmid partitioning protein RepB [Shimia thalassica]|uniref:plasmid partitioning protein RepB n=1 Tax=Shimia thalassica TaxID=1715693 RepID=UPI002732C044|nr:plasmid partitioning protein RepB [Shimia thalassica]MDP2582107.1 plasmid partitioning protein RepB [Shimia thalassica]
MPEQKNKDGIIAGIRAATAKQEMNSEVLQEAPAAERDTSGSRISNRRMNAITASRGIQDIDPNLILPWGPKDRLDVELTAVNSEKDKNEQVFDQSVVELANSIRPPGSQHVPVLLRPSENQKGRYEVIYGRRRILACRYLGQDVRALVRKMEDKDALLAKGLENSSRADLSYYERARFAQEILEQGYTNEEVYSALSISKNVLSQYTRVTNNVPNSLGDKIGPAPKSGRPKWTTLAVALEEERINTMQAHNMLKDLSPAMSSDQRLDHLLSHLSKEPDILEPVNGVKIKTTSGGLTMKVTAKDDPAFANWLKTNIGELIQESRERFEKESGTEEAG